MDRMYQGGRFAYNCLAKCAPAICNELKKYSHIGTIKHEPVYIDAINRATHMFAHYIDEVFVLKVNSELQEFVKNKYAGYNATTFNGAYVEFDFCSLSITIENSTLCYSMNYATGKIEYTIDLNELINKISIAGHWRHNHQGDNPYMQYLVDDKIYFADYGGRYLNEPILQEQIPNDNHVLYFLGRIRKDNHDEIYPEKKADYQMF